LQPHAPPADAVPPMALSCTARTCPRAAHGAFDTRDEKTVQVELAAEAASLTSPIRGGTTPFGAGFGVRIGLDISGFYVGVSMLDFLGAKDVDVSCRALFFGAEFGYGFRLPAVVGPAPTPRHGPSHHIPHGSHFAHPCRVVTTASGSSTTSTSSDTLIVNNVFLQPAVTLELASGGHFVAIDGNMLDLPGIAYSGADATTWISYRVQFQLGVRF
jgi:hypothetical protein